MSLTGLFMYAGGVTTTVLYWRVCDHFGYQHSDLGWLCGAWFYTIGVAAYRYYKS